MLRFVRDHDQFTIEAEVMSLESENIYREDVSWQVCTSATGCKPGRRTFRTRSAAYAAYHRAIAEQQASGYVLAIGDILVSEPPKATFVARADAERAVQEDPANEDRWLALAAAWSASGDPRGDAIALERALKAHGDPTAFLRTKQAFEPIRRARIAHVFGPLGRDAYRVQATFVRGLVDTLVMADETRASGRTTGELVEIALASPFARFVRSLRVVDADQAVVDRVVAGRVLSVEVVSIE